MRLFSSPHRGMLVVLGGALLLLAACGTSTASSPGSSATSGSSTPPPPPGATAVPTAPVSTTLCSLMSQSQVGTVLGGTISTVQSNKTTANGETSINCTYLPSGNAVHIAAEISYLFSANGQASYAANKHDDASRQEQETDLSGLGDAAFWAVKSADPNTLQLSVLKGNVLLVMTLLGTGLASSMLIGAIALAKSALPSI
jgi:hypothetical protein